MSFLSGLCSTDLDINLTADRLSGLETGELDQRKAISAKENLQLSFSQNEIYKIPRMKSSS